MTSDQSLLQAALLGYESEARRIQAAITDLQQRLGKKSAPSKAADSPTPAKRKGHKISPEGRARIAEAQRRRWAAAKKK